ncbi:MAG: MobA/MobL family protein, partial [Abitibacteriaceae bacterium]|nr:MobA/MobL family protein [Abditibacteriaceae bacterium]
MQTKTLHFRAVSISRHKAQPDNAVKACAYRSGQNLYDEKERRSHYYGNRGGVVEIGLFAPVAAPEWMRDADQRRLWQRFGNEIEKVEDGHNRR